MIISGGVGSVLIVVKVSADADAYMLWSTETASPSRIGTRSDMLAVLSHEGAGRSLADDIMATVDATGTSDPGGRCGWSATVDVAGYDPRHGFRQPARRLPRARFRDIADAILAESPELATAATSSATI